ncbi:MAG: serine protein kinase PrkA [Pseudomonadota bacterium]
MERIRQSLDNLGNEMTAQEGRALIPFEAFLDALTQQPARVIRNIFQTFHDMVRAHVGEGEDEYPDDPESINYVCYDCNSLFVNGADRPFFADRLFANRLINHVESMRRGSQQNKIYIFEGPHGSGKSTFLNNLLQKFEIYANTEEGRRFEIVWHLDRDLMGSPGEVSTLNVFEKLFEMQEEMDKTHLEAIREKTPLKMSTQHIDVPCPSHDHPLLIIPKDLRRSFLDELLENDEFKWKLFTEKEYEWVFKQSPCTICTSLYQALVEKLGSARRVFDMVTVRAYLFNRRLGEGISVFNPGDRPMRQSVLTNEMLQRRISNTFRDSNQVNYIYSRYAKTNNGIYALMDIKNHNTERMLELHNIVSEGVHKVEDIEENVNSLLFGLMNPEDRENIKDMQSFSDRIEYIKIPYILDIKTEVEIYRNIFGRHIDDNFLPRVLHNFARVVLSSRLNLRSEAMLEWIPLPAKYHQYCDDNLQLLKMEIYTGHIPPWLSEEDRKNLTYKRRKRIIGESENEGWQGYSGRDSIRIFNDFYLTYAREDRLITMAELCKFFSKKRKGGDDFIPDGLLDSLLRMYDYTVLQEVKECLYYYNREKISRDIQNYLFAVNFDMGLTTTCKYTGDSLTVSEEFLSGIEGKLLPPDAGKGDQLKFRQDTQKTYTTQTLTQEMMVEGLAITETQLYETLHDRYVYRLKEKVLDPMIENENFRRAIKDLDSEDFKTYDEKTRQAVTYLIGNLESQFGYTRMGAREVSLYVIDAQDRDKGTQKT